MFVRPPRPPAPLFHSATGSANTLSASDLQPESRAPKMFLLYGREF
jgi:hypothetical protein